MVYRTERDSLGEVAVPEEAYWGAQTERSRRNFMIGTEAMPREIIAALALVKKACAAVNGRLGVLDERRAAFIAAACDEISAGALDEQFPLSVWQTGSGTQTNMNVNEVIAEWGNRRAGEKLLHPNDHVNMSQSSNDTFPAAMHIAAALAVTEKLIPAVEALAAEFGRLEADNAGIIKLGRTHLQDATPLAFSQEISAWRVMLEKNAGMLRASLAGLFELSVGGTAVGTGLNAPRGFGEAVAAELASYTGLAFVSAANKFHALSSKDALVFAHGALKALAANAMKIANDIRWLASGPRCGLGEIGIPENEPGSSIMPGKVNPTQCEALTMVAVQVMGNDAALGIAASQGNFELNVFMPVCIYNFMQSVRLLSDSLSSFTRHCAAGICAKRDVMENNVRRSLMLATALNPHIGYDKAAMAVQKAYRENLSLKDACVRLGFLTAERFDALCRPGEMV